MSGSSIATSEVSASEDAAGTKWLDSHPRRHYCNAASL
jgi:hypothetical protein